MTPHELIHHLASLGIALSAEAGRLRVNAPRGSLTEALKSAIGENKDALLEILSRGATPTGATIERLDRARPLRLSSFQERLWVLQRLSPTATDFNMVSFWSAPVARGLPHALAAFRSVLARHEVLRSRFVELRDVVVAQAVSAEAVPIETRDLSDQDSPARQAALEAEALKQAHRPFDLTSECATRVFLFELDAHEIGVVLCIHHIAADAWSLSLLRRELTEAFGSQELSSSPPPLQYADYAGWQRATESSPQVAADIEWWCGKLAGAPELSLFPPDRSGSVAGAAMTSFRLDAALSDSIRAMARRQGTTVYMALLAACAAVLRWHTGQNDVVLGSPQGVRERSELETMVGPFVNLLLVRLDMADDPSFSELLNRARDAMLDAHEHRHVPVEKLIEKLRPKRAADHAPLFQMAVVYHNVPVTDDSVVVGGGALHEVTWFVRDVGAELACTLEYRADLFSQVAMARVARHLEAALRSAAAASDVRISGLRLLDESERSRLLQDFNATHLALSGKDLIAHFEARVLAQPGAIAISHEGKSLSYGDLNARANKLARLLQGHGVSRGVLVAVCMQRSPLLCVALLAIQKAGGAYLPLDPGFPRERLEFMLADSGSKILLTSDDASGGVALPDGVVKVDVAEAAAQLEPLSADNPLATAGVSDPAYMIYTSGSTGRPKGVIVPRAALANFLESMAREPGLGPSDVLAAVTTISFDIAGLELYLPLITGARIELVPREVAADGIDLAQLLQSSGATVLQATPATWRLLIEAGWQGSPGFRALCGGEALARDLSQALLGRVAQLWNLYGPTETTVWSTVSRVMPDEPITIGRPIANTQVYVREARGGLAPIGVPGEIWIGGEGVALGYHARPELTAERFVPDPYSSGSDARLYRTGDLGRWREDGRLEHLGRLDHQVKIRGFRVEIGEIEAVLGSHPAIRQCVVVAREAAVGDLRLVAYVVYQPGDDLTVSDVRRHLRGELPDYMIPSLVVTLDAVPLTPNGKVDRAALPDPFRSRSVDANAYEPPAPGLEQTLAAIWADVLKIDRVGAQDNFFELGGHSLLSLRVAATVEKSSGWRMDPRLLFFQSLSQIAAAGTAALGAAPAA